MSNYLAFREELISQIPALQLLKAMGYQYLTPEESLAARGGKLSNVILERALKAKLKELNRITFKGQTYPFSESNIKQAIQSNHISGDGPFTKKCNHFLEEGLNVPKALLTTSCTHALELSGILLNIQPGDEVIIPAFTFVSTVMLLYYMVLHPFLSLSDQIL